MTSIRARNSGPTSHAVARIPVTATTAAATPSNRTKPRGNPDVGGERPFLKPINGSVTDGETPPCETSALTLARGVVIWQPCDDRLPGTSSLRDDRPLSRDEPCNIGFLSSARPDSLQGQDEDQDQDQDQDQDHLAASERRQSSHHAAGAIRHSAAHLARVIRAVSDVSDTETRCSRRRYGRDLEGARNDRRGTNRGARGRTCANEAALGVAGSRSPAS
jgi:hypothetical protein